VLERIRTIGLSSGRSRRRILAAQCLGNAPVSTFDGSRREFVRTLGGNLPAFRTDGIGCHPCRIPRHPIIRPASAAWYIPVSHRAPAANAPRRLFPRPTRRARIAARRRCVPRRGTKPGHRGAVLNADDDRSFRLMDVRSSVIRQWHNNGKPGAWRQARRGGLYGRTRLKLAEQWLHGWERAIFARQLFEWPCVFALDWNELYLQIEQTWWSKPSSIPVNARGPAAEAVAAADIWHGNRFPMACRFIVLRVYEALAMAVKSRLFLLGPLIELDSVRTG